MIPDLERFTEGDCWLLAKRLHRDTGWPIMAFAIGNEPDDHAWVERSDGMCLDIQGICTRKEMAARFGHNESNIDSFPVAAFHVDPEFGPYSYRRAKSVSNQLLSLYGLDKSPAMR